MRNKRHLGVHIVTASAILLSVNVTRSAINPGKDWPVWRGPSQNGIAAQGQNPPVEWNDKQNILWHVPIPGRGHGTPTVVADRIYLATADELKQTQSVLCLDRLTGKAIWSAEVHQGNLITHGHRNTTQASSTVACDGERIFINFLNGGAIYTTALDLNGKQLWQQKVCDYVTHQGFGSSPVLHGSLVLVSADHRGGGTLAGLDRLTGKIVWSVLRPKIANYTSPAVVRANGRDQLVLGGCNLISSFDPLTGKKLWEVDGSTEECVVTMVTDGERVFMSGGYPKNHAVAILADGSGKVAWQNNTRLYVPSMIPKDGHLFAVLDAGMAVCWKSDTGEELWKERLGGDFYASPVMVGDRIYASNVAGKTFVFVATAKAFQLLASNQLGDEAFASPVICDSRIYLRVAKNGAERQEILYCIGTK
ncbi:MAG: PQQ-binding-like beta-propeller repeat protein [Verrucomicrobia bacterium]|nr:PQQ-binding-like beta-propeller repeat protein [Verrucomicrobiota bacterium]